MAHLGRGDKELGLGQLWPVNAMECGGPGTISVTLPGGKDEGLWGCLETEGCRALIHIPLPQDSLDVGELCNPPSSTTLEPARDNVEQQRIPPAPLWPGPWVISSGLCPPQEIGLAAT